MAEQPDEVGAGLEAQPDVRTIRGGFDERVERRRTRIVLLPFAAAERVGADRRGRSEDVESRRRPGVVSLELAELPLAREEPERIVDPRGKRLVHLAGRHRLVSESVIASPEELRIHFLRPERAVQDVGHRDDRRPARQVAMLDRADPREVERFAEHVQQHLRGPRFRGSGGTAIRMACGARASGWL